MKKTVLYLLIAALWACKKDDTPIQIPISTSRPNILLIIADDVGMDASPGYSVGSTKPSMPNLQSLASNGITFDNVWAYPVCSPTRASILTGKYGFHTGVLNAEEASTISSNELTLQSYLDQNTSNAYTHAIVGKWHLSNNEPNRPTQMGVGYYAGLLGGGASDYYSWRLTENGQSGNFQGYITTKITDLAIDWINQQSKPWFCWVAYTAPHTPFHLPPDSMHSQGNLPSDQASIDANPLPYYMGMLESLDFEIGRLQRNIPADELENTIIIYIGDNGTPTEVIQAPYQSTQAKGSIYQGGIHVPMIVSGFGVGRSNERDDNLISSTDLFSTIADVAEAGVPTNPNSYSFKKLLSQSGAGNRTYNYSEGLSASNPNRSGYTIRNAQYKLMVFDSGQRRFFDLLADPYEQNPLTINNLTAVQQTNFDELVNQASSIRQ